MTRSVSFARSRNRLLTVAGNLARIWDVDGADKSLSVRLELAPHAAYGCPGAIGPDGSTFALGDSAGVLRLFSDNRDELWHKGAEGRLRADSVAFSPDGALVALSTGSGVLVRAVYDGALLFEVPGAWTDAQFSPDGLRLGLTDQAGTLGLHDVKTGRLLRTLADIVGAPHCLCFSPDSRRIAIGLGDGTVRVYGAPDLHLVAVLSGMRPAVWSVAFHPDGSRLAVGSKDRCIHLWDTATWTELVTLREHTATVRDLAWSHDGQRLASAGFDGTARIWDAGARRPR